MKIFLHYGSLFITNCLKMITLYALRKQNTKLLKQADNDMLYVYKNFFTQHK